MADLVVVGAGPAGMHLARTVARLEPAWQVVVLGAEPWQPYDRVQLSALLAGHTDLGGIALEPELVARHPNVQVRLGEAVTAVDRHARRVHLARGGVYGYRHLALATGSRAHRPDLPGVDLPGVYTFRDLDDTQRLAARRARTRRTVVLGGGLLGLEAARGMQRAGTQVVVLEHGAYPMARQLDAGAGAVLAAQVRALGIQLRAGVRVRALTGDAQRGVRGVALADGTSVDCDTVVLATGIVPNADLARDAGIAVGRGVHVDDRMRTADECVWAVGECAEHAGVVHGTVAPALEQAAVAAHTITGRHARYVGSVVATQLKVAGTAVYTFGETGAVQAVDAAREVLWRAPPAGHYRKLVLRRGRCVGVIALGPWPALPRVQDLVRRRARVWPWQCRRVRETGFIWSRHGQPEVVHWAAAATVCQCTGVTRGALGQAIAAGARTVPALAGATRASSVCGSCRPLLEQLLGQSATAQPVRGAAVLAGGALVAAAAVALAVAAPDLPYAASQPRTWHWDVLWRSGAWKQATGYTALGAALIASALVVPRRTATRRLGSYSAWRVAHVVLAGVVLAALAAHTGARVGHQLNAWLAVSLLATSGAGAVLAGVVAAGQRLGARRAQRLRAAAWWAHLVALAPVPALLAVHIFKSYWF